MVFKMILTCVFELMALTLKQSQRVVESSPSPFQGLSKRRLGYAATPIEGGGVAAASSSLAGVAPLRDGSGPLIDGSSAGFFVPLSFWSDVALTIS